MARVIVVTSGKGGVGKTTTTSNIGMSLARLGHSTLLIDADVGLRNLDLLLGLENRIIYTGLDVLKEAKNQRDKAYQALIKTTKLQHEVEEKLENAIKAIKTMRDGSDAVMLHTAREILEELEGYKE